MPQSSKTINLIQASILITITLSGLWLVSDFIAFLLSILIPIIALALIILSLIVEYLEKSNVPAWYYRLMVLLIVLPLLIGLLFSAINGFHFNWTQH